MYYTYILQCGDGSLYTGYAADPIRREALHNSGKGAKYTRSHLPVHLVYTEAFETKGEALRREAEIKRLPRHEKLSLIQSGETHC